MSAGQGSDPFFRPDAPPGTGPVAERLIQPAKSGTIHHGGQRHRRPSPASERSSASRPASPTTGAQGPPPKPATAARAAPGPRASTSRPRDTASPRTNRLTPGIPLHPRDTASPPGYRSTPGIPPHPTQTASNCENETATPGRDGIWRPRPQRRAETVSPGRDGIPGGKRYPGGEGAGPQDAQLPMGWNGTALEHVGLAAQAGALPERLSGGERQRVAIRPRPRLPTGHRPGR